MERDRYKHLISSLSKVASLLPNIKKIVFEPAGSNAFKMSWNVPAAGRNIPFGRMEIDPKFMEFLRSGSAPEGSPSAKEAYKYFPSYDLTFDQETSQKEYDIINDNLDILMGGDPSAINRYEHTGTPQAALKLSFDNSSGSPRHEKLRSAFNKWRGEGSVSELQPVLTKKNINLKKISYREKSGDE